MEIAATDTTTHDDPKNTLRRLYQEAKAGISKRIIFPEQSDERVLEACQTLSQQGLVTPILLSAPKHPIAGVEVFDQSAAADEHYQQALSHLLAAQAHKGMTEVQARKALQDPLLLAACLVTTGYADAGIAGSLSTTASVLKAGLKGIGVAKNSSPGHSSLVSSVLLMQLPGQPDLLSYADCAVNPSPNAQQLAQIALDSATTHERLTHKRAAVALLSFSSMGSAEHQCLEPIREAKRIALERQPSLAIEGEIQFDAAFSPEIGQRKAPGSPVAGHANVFVFPNLNAANIGCKITECMGGANSIGPILQGFEKPWFDLSRNCKSLDIINTAVIAAALS